METYNNGTYEKIGKGWSNQLNVLDSKTIFQLTAAFLK